MDILTVEMAGQRMARNTSPLPSAKLCLKDLTHERRLGKMSNMLTAAFVPGGTGKREVVEVPDRRLLSRVSGEDR